MSKGAVTVETAKSGGIALQEEFLFREEAHQVQYSGRAVSFEDGSATGRSCFVTSNPCHSGSIFSW
jgi:hypothetical protein